MPYDVFMHLDLLDTVSGSSVQRRRIMEFVRRLRDDPGTPGDYTEKDSSCGSGK